MSRSPARAMTGNLMWTRTGTVWAIWRLKAMPYGLREFREKVAVRDAHQGLLRGIVGESLVMGICVGLDPATIVERMMADVDLAANPDWALECEATLDTLDVLEPGARAHFLAVPLGAQKGWDRFAEPMRGMKAELRAQLGLPAELPPVAVATRLGEQARQIATTIPHVFEPTPATPAQMVWLQAHAQRRGLGIDLDLPEPNEGIRGASTQRHAGCALPEPLIDEGGQTDLSRRDVRTMNPASRRYVKVLDSGDPDASASFQVVQTIAELPSGGIAFPGGEFIGQIDDFGFDFDVDWAIRLQVRSQSEVASANRRALANINDQLMQRDSESISLDSQISRAARDLAEYTAILQSDENEVEVLATTILCVAAEDATTAMDRGRVLRSAFGGRGFRIVAPLGYQRDLWWAMLPGVPTARVVRDYAQIYTSRTFAASMPLTSTDLGDRSGSPLALNITSGRSGIVMHDIAGAIESDVSGSVAVAGELGGGKSVTLKRICGDVVDRGGRMIAADRTTVGEYAIFADSIARATVVDVNDPVFSLDPLRIFGLTVGTPIAQSFLNRLLGFKPMSEMGGLLDDVLVADYMATHDLRALGDVIEHLSTLSGEAAKQLAQRMRLFARKPYGRVIFDSAVPALDLTSRAIIVRTHTLQLPSASELENTLLFDQLPAEKLFGRAIYALIAGLARALCFADTSELAVFVCDECHHITASPEGSEELSNFVRDGRKHKAALLLGSHDPIADFGSETMRGLIPTRILMRHQDRALARNGLEWLGLDSTSDELLDEVMKRLSPVGPDGVPPHRRGEALMRDSHGNVGKVKVLAPCAPHRAKAVLTTPKTPAAQQADSREDAIVGAVR